MQERLQDSSFHRKGHSHADIYTRLYDANNVLCTTVWTKKILESYKKYEYDVKVSRTRTFVRGQRRSKVRPCGRTLN